MTNDEFARLQPGQPVAHAMQPDVVYMVWANYGGHVTAIRVADMTNPAEWIIIGEARRRTIEVFPGDEVIQENGQINAVMRGSALIYNRMADGDNVDLIYIPQNS